MGGQKMKSTYSFDDYGKIESTSVDIVMNGKTNPMRTIKKEGNSGKPGC